MRSSLERSNLVLKLCLFLFFIALATSQLGCPSGGSGTDGGQSGGSDSSSAATTPNGGNSTTNTGNTNADPGSDPPGGTNTDPGSDPPGGTQPGALTGAIFTATAHALTVSDNLYANWCDVYLNGGPKPDEGCNATGLPNETYYFQVTDPSGTVLLSSDPIARRVVRADHGWFVEYLGGSSEGCDHAIGSGKCSGSISVQLMPFNTTPDPNGACKVWLTPVSAYDVTNADSSFGFLPGRSLTQTFRCVLDQHYAMSAQLRLTMTLGELHGSIVGGTPPYTCTAVTSDADWTILGCTTHGTDLKVYYDPEGACRARVTALVTDAKGFQTEASQCVNACGECEISPDIQTVQQGQPAQDFCVIAPCDLSALTVKWTGPPGVTLVHDNVKCVTPDTSMIGAFNYCIMLNGDDALIGCCATLDVTPP